MNIIEEVSKKINLNEFKQLINNYNITENDTYIFKFRNPSDLEKHLIHFYKIFQKYKISSSDNVLDIGSGFCYVDILCKTLHIKCTNIELEANNENSLEFLYQKFHNLLKSRVIYHKINSTTDLPINEKYDFVFICNQTFDEKIVQNKIIGWNVAQWCEFFEYLNKFLSDKGKILINWSKQKYVKDDLDPIYSSNNNGKLLKYIHNKNYDYFLHNKQYKVEYI